MFNHFDALLNLRKVILERSPKHILELGALNGEGTKKLMSLFPKLGFKLTVISDDCDPAMGDWHTTFIKGVSYTEIEKLEDNSIDFCLLDTDHNYWTLQKELLALHPKLTENALVAIHDVDEFYYNTGVAGEYGNGMPYPVELIEKYGHEAGSLGTCLIDFLAANRFAYRLIKWVPESNGCALIRKQPKQYPVLFLRAVEGKGKRSVCSV